MKTLTVRVPEELVARVDRALRAEGLEVREFVKSGGFQLEVANAIGGAPGVPRLLQYGALPIGQTVTYKLRARRTPEGVEYIENVA